MTETRTDALYATIVAARRRREEKAKALPEDDEQQETFLRATVQARLRAPRRQVV